MQTALLLVVLISFVSVEVKGHGRLMKPPSRSSVWRVPEFAHWNPPPNYDDNALFCGGIHQETNPGTNCGVCGDPFSQAKPRRNEVGGEYYRGIITGKYSAGQVIDVEAEITAAHLGFMEWRLCTNIQSENQECFNRHLLQRADGKGSRVPVSYAGKYKIALRLPAGVTCDHCVLQWNYRAGNNWGQCEDGSGRNGCGSQETFRGCSDISIS